MSEFEELVQEDELFEEAPQEEEGFEIDWNKVPLEKGLYIIGLMAARIRKAPNPSAFAANYAETTKSLLELVGFKEALAQSLPKAMLNPKIRLILGIGIIVGGVFIVPVEEVNRGELADNGQVWNWQELLRSQAGGQVSRKQEAPGS